MIFCLVSLTHEINFFFSANFRDLFLSELVGLRSSCCNCLQMHLGFVDKFSDCDIRNQLLLLQALGIV